MQEDNTEPEGGSAPEETSEEPAAEETSEPAAEGEESSEEA
tara:strand:- start:6604 stop:6726 length:123 start_codon:yes stop_codon:yes gene_type:complete